MLEPETSPNAPRLDIEAIEATLGLIPRNSVIYHFFDDMRALVGEVKQLRAALKESERWSAVMKRLYLEELANNKRFECCCCGERVAKSEAHVCLGNMDAMG